MLDPELRPLIEAYTPVELTNETLPRMRSAPAGTETVAGVPVRVHRPAGVEGPLACVVSMHGGGYVFGSSANLDPLLESWCAQLGVLAVAVEYRLAPEHPYPAALDDGYAVLREVATWPEVGAVGVHGVSAGGGLAAAMALLARHRGDVEVAFQLLESPMLDDRQQTLSSRADGPAVWSRDDNAFGWRSYLRGLSSVPAFAAPARADDLSGLPPAFVAVGALDGFRDEDVDYALRLMQAGVDTELHVYPGVPHGFQMAAHSRVAKQSRRDAADWLAARCAELRRATR